MFKSFFKRPLEYTRLSKREKVSFICEGQNYDSVEDEYLEKLFDMKISSPYERNKLIEELAKDCEKIINAFEDSVFVQDVAARVYKIIIREFVYPQNLSFEILVNLILFFVSLKVSWSDYLLAFPSGQKIIQNVFESKYGAFYFFTIVKSVYFNSAFDDVLFKQEFFKILPPSKTFLPPSLRSKTALWLSDRITTEALLKAFKKYFGE